MKAASTAAAPAARLTLSWRLGLAQWETDGAWTPRNCGGRALVNQAG